MPITVVVTSFMTKFEPNNGQNGTIPVMLVYTIAHSVFKNARSAIAEL